MSEGQEHLVWTPIGFSEASEAIVVRPYRASDPNPKHLAREAPVAGIYVGTDGIGFSLKRKDKGDEALQTHWYPLVHLPHGWTRPGAKQNACIIHRQGPYGGL